MNTRSVVFVLSVAGVAVLDGCEGINLNDPHVKVCHDDSSYAPITYPNGRTDSALVIWHADTLHCRKAA